MVQQIINQLTVETMFSIAIIVYLTRIFVKMAHSLLGQLFWLGFSLVGVYNIISDNLHILSGYSIMMITIFLSVIVPISKKVYSLLHKTKNVIFRCKVSDLPKYQTKFGQTQEQIEFKKLEDQREQEEHKKQQEYFSKISKKLDAF